MPLLTQCANNIFQRSENILLLKLKAVAFNLYIGVVTFKG